MSLALVSISLMLSSDSTFRCSFKSSDPYPAVFTQSYASPLPSWLSVVNAWSTSVTSLGAVRGLREGWDQKGKHQFHVTSRKNRGSTGWNNWTRCLHSKNRLTTNCRQVQTNHLTSGRYRSFNGIVIAVFNAFIQSLLNSFLHDGSSRKQPMSFNITWSLR